MDAVKACRHGPDVVVTSADEGAVGKGWGRWVGVGVGLWYKTTGSDNISAREPKFALTPASLRINEAG